MALCFSSLSHKFLTLEEQGHTLKVPCRISKLMKRIYSIIETSKDWSRLYLIARLYCWSGKTGKGSRWSSSHAGLESSRVSRRAPTAVTAHLTAGEEKLVWGTKISRRQSRRSQPSEHGWSPFAEVLEASELLGIFVIFGKHCCQRDMLEGLARRLYRLQFVDLLISITSSASTDAPQASRLVLIAFDTSNLAGDAATFWPGWFLRLGRYNWDNPLCVSVPHAPQPHNNDKRAWSIWIGDISENYRILFPYDWSWKLQQHEAVGIV